MAPRKKTTSPAAEFVKNSADIINQLMKSLYTPLARLASVQSYEAAKDRLGDVLSSVNSNYYTVSDHKSVLIEVGTNIKNATKSNEFINRFKRDRNGYSFSIRKKPTQGGEFTFSTALKTFPGSNIGSSFETNLSDSDKLSILWAAMAAAGFTFTPKEDKFDAYFTPVILEKDDKKAKQKAADIDEIETAVEDTTGIAGVLELINDYSNHSHNQKMMNAAFNSVLKYEVEVDAFAGDVNVSIRPVIELSISDSLISYMAETDDKTAVDYLTYTWIDHAVTRATSRSKGTKNLPAVDLRVTARKLRLVKDKFNVAKARVNEDGFCINNAGLPMYVPTVDSTQQFMKDHSNFSVDDEGYFQYESVASEWSAKIVMTDWFNDVLVYTDSMGKLAVQRLLGYIPLDASSEYVFLNTSPISNARLSSIMRDVQKVIDGVVTIDDAQKYLDVEYAKPNSYNAGKITESFSTLYSNFVSRPLTNTLTPSDPDFRHDTLWRPLTKHMFGIEVEELPDYHRALAVHLSAYLQAVTEKHRDITMAVMNRLRGVEYFLRMGKKLKQKWTAVRTAASEEAQKRRNAPRMLSEIDVPNLDAGGNLKGYMPHQVKVLSDRSSGANTGLVGVAAGGGKSLMQLVDVLMKLEANPTWRPIIVTKPRLVKGLISEFNYFSKGKVNVVSLRKSQLDYMARMLRINTAAALIKWVNSLPTNTIFVCGYTDFSSMSNTYEDLDVPNRVMMTDVGLPQFLHLLRIIGFEQVSLDESHIIKNMKSRRSRYAFSLLAQADNKMELSGTIVSNTAVDLIGQSYGLNPMIFGDDIETFKDDYNLTAGLIKTDEAAFKINERLSKFTQQSAATKEDWAFVLPDLHDKYLTPALTEKQAKFYASLMLKAELEMKAKLEGMTSDDEDGEEDEEENEARMIMAADATLASVEQFMVSPDTNEQYRAWSETPTGADLISPMVKAIDAQLDIIYRDMGADHSNNKTAVFGIHKVASGHFMRHTKHKNICLHYRAGDEEVIRQFKSNPDKIVLVADSTSLREGENLQMLSHIFDMQATWAPGDFEQLISRMYRPDPKGVYNKDQVTHWWITPEHQAARLPTVSAVKLARMISKAISNARLRYDRDPRWRKISWEFEDLDLLKMNLKTIFHSTQRDLQPYHSAWEKFVRWEREINQERRKQVAEQVEAENPGIRIMDSAGRILDRNLFTKLVMREAKSTKTLPGSKRVFTAWEPGAVPADIHDMSLSILGDDTIERGQYVITEFGPGIVHNAGENQLVVELYGLRKVKVYRSRVAVPNGEGVAKLTAIINNATAWQTESFVEQMHVLTKIDVDASLAPKNRKSRGKPAVESIPEAETPPVRLKPSLIRPKPIEEEEDEDEDEVEKDEEESQIDIDDIYAYILNGMPALVIVDAPSGVENFGWNRVSPFTGLSFRDWATAEKFLTSASKKFAIANSKYDTLLEEMEEFKTGKAMKLTKRVTDAQARNFFLQTHRRLKAATDGRERIDPYWLAIGTQVYLAFSKESHNAKVFQWIRSMVAKNAGAMKKPKEVGELHVNIFNSLSEAAADLRVLAQNFNISEADVRQELRNIKEDIVALRGRKVRPS